MKQAHGQPVKGAEQSTKFEQLHSDRPMHAVTEDMGGLQNDSRGPPKKQLPMLRAFSGLSMSR